MKKPHLRKQQPGEVKAMSFEASMDHFVRIQEHQREFLAWLESQDVEGADHSHKGFQAVR